MKLRTCAALAAVAFVALWAGVAFTGDSNDLFSLQGRLTDTNGVPLNGIHSVRVSFYDDASSSNLLYRETFSSVNVSNGIYTVLLGDSPSTGTVAGLFANADIWMGLAIDSATDLSPLTHVAAAGLTHRANAASNIGNMSENEANTLVAGPGSDASALHGHGGGGGNVPIVGKFLGFSNSTTNGGQGIAYMNKLCNDTFNGTRMCTNYEIAHADTGPVSIPSGRAWFHAHPVAGGHSGGTTDWMWGWEGYSWQTEQYTNCRSWTTSSSSSSYGAANINNAGRMYHRNHYNSSVYCHYNYNVACCDNSGF